MTFQVYLNEISLRSFYFNLHQNGATRITTVDIDNYIKAVPGAYTSFERKKENGIEYLEDCEELSHPENPLIITIQNLKSLMHSVT